MQIRGPTNSRPPRGLYSVQFTTTFRSSRREFSQGGQNGADKTGPVPILFNTVRHVIRDSRTEEGAGCLVAEERLPEWRAVREARGQPGTQPRKMRSNKRLASLGKSATEDCGLAFFRGRLVWAF